LSQEKFKNEIPNDELGKYTKPHVVLGSIIWDGVREHLSSDRREKLGIHLVITDLFLLELNLWCHILYWKVF